MYSFMNAKLFIVPTLKLTSTSKRQIFKFFQSCNCFEKKEPKKLGHTAVVIGATSRIGESICKALLANGVKNLILASTNQTKGIKTIKKLRCFQPDSFICHIICDVTNSDDVNDVFVRTKKLHRWVDVVVNNAGIINEKNWNQTVDVNTKGLVHGLDAAMNYMSEAKGGRGGTIINVGSGLGFLAGAPVFTASKLFVLGLSKCYGSSYHFKKTNVKVMTLLPGLTQTKVMQNLMTRPEDSFKSKLLAQELLELEPIDQHPSYCGKAIETMLRNGKNGSLWIAEDESIYQIEIPEFRKLRIKPEGE